LLLTILLVIAGIIRRLAIALIVWRGAVLRGLILIRVVLIRRWCVRAWTTWLRIVARVGRLIGILRGVLGLRARIWRRRWLLVRRWRGRRLLCLALRGLLLGLILLLLRPVLTLLVGLLLGRIRLLLLLRVLLGLSAETEAQPKRESGYGSRCPIYSAHDADI